MLFGDLIIYLLVSSFLFALLFLTLDGVYLWFFFVLNFKGKLLFTTQFFAFSSVLFLSDLHTTCKISSFNSSFINISFLYLISVNTTSVFLSELIFEEFLIFLLDVLLEFSNMLLDRSILFIKDLALYFS